MDELQCISSALATVVRSSLNCNLVFDERGLITEYNQAAENAYGYRRDEMIGQSISRFLAPGGAHQADRDRLTRFIEGELAAPHGTRVRVDGRLKDGRIVPLEVTVSEFSDGRQRLFLGTLRDLSSELQHEEELQRSEERLALAVDGAKLGTWTFDLRTGETWYSDRSKKMYGLAPDEELSPQRLRELVHPDDWGEVARPYRDGFRESDRVAVEYRVTCPDGSIRWVYSLGAATRDDAGRAYTVHGVHLDITDRKRVENELARSREALHQTEKLAALGSLLAGVSHELNNPLAAIIGQAAMLEEDGRGTPFEARARKIGAGADRCARIVQTFLAMARQREPQRSQVGVNALVTAALELTDYGLRTAGILVETQLALDVPPIDADRDQLHQVLVNLLINAQQALEDGQSLDRRLTISTARSGTGGALIDVRDSGPGIAPGVAARIFEPFFTTKPQGSGTGVGLSFSQGIVEAHGGTLRAMSSECGALFRIELPPAMLHTAKAADDKELGAKDGAERAEPKPARSLALVIDDEPDVADTLSELLSRQGFDVTVAADGAEALALLEMHQFDLILSDLRMPNVGGAEFYRRLLKRDASAAARVAFVTGDTLGGSSRSLIEKSGRPVLEKPFTTESVRQLVTGLSEAVAA